MKGEAPDEADATPVALHGAGARLAHGAARDGCVVGAEGVVANRAPLRTNRGGKTSELKGYTQNIIPPFLGGVNFRREVKRR